MTGCRTLYTSISARGRIASRPGLIRTLTAHGVTSIFKWTAVHMSWEVLARLSLKTNGDGGAEVKFVVQLGEFSKALRYLRPARAKGRKAQAECVDINARATEIEIVAPGVSFPVPAEVTRAGYARLPYLTFEWLTKALRTFRQPLRWRC